MEHQEKAAFESEKVLTKQEEEKEYEHNHNNEEKESHDEIGEICTETSEKDEFQTEFQQQLEDAQRLAREETPTPPADTGR